MEACIKTLQGLKIVPVIKVNDAKNAYALGEVLVRGGLPVAEITFRTEAAEASIKEMRKIPGLLVGAGTITNVAQAKTAFAKEQGIPIFPGICTPSELMSLLAFDLPVAKFFPAENYGGLKTIGALAGPFPKMLFIPTGGIHPGNIREYLSHPNIIACGGSWMVKEALIDEGRFDEIEALVKEAKALVDDL